MKVEKINKYIIKLNQDEARILKDALYYHFKSWTQTEIQEELMKEIYDQIDIDIERKVEKE